MITDSRPHRKPKRSSGIPWAVHSLEVVACFYAGGRPRFDFGIGKVLYANRSTKSVPYGPVILVAVDRQNRRSFLAVPGGVGDERQIEVAKHQGEGRSI